MLTQLLNTFNSEGTTFVTFESKWTCHNCNCQCTQAFRNTCNNWCCPCTRATTHTSSDKDHISSCQCFCKCFFTFFSCLTTNFRLTSGTKATSQFRTQLDYCFCFRRTECLNISISCNKFNTSKTFFNHSVDGVSATSTDTDNFNYRTLN